MAKLNDFTKEFNKLLRVIDRPYYNSFKALENISIGEALDDMEFHLVEAVYYIDKPFKGELRKPEKVQAIAEYIKKYGNKDVVEKFKADMARVAYPNEESHKWTKIALDTIGEF